jgi:hypothetical protein
MKNSTRRDFLASTALAGLTLNSCSPPAASAYSLCLFEADVTPPAVGHPFLAGRISRSVVDPLFVHGFVLRGPDAPIVLCAVDWCEIRNESYEAWRSKLAAAAGTTKERVLVTCIHQHDAPYTDRVAQSYFEKHNVPAALCVPEFEDRMIERVASAVKSSLAEPRSIDRIGVGQAKAVELGSNRRYVAEDGTVSWGRGSTTRDPAIRALPEGLVDPYVKTISFWSGDQAVAALSCYATHPMSHYGEGDISADFVGMARAQRQKDTPGVKQIYVSGCSGDITVGKYNDGSKENRPIFAGRLHKAMAAAWDATETFPIEKAGFRNVPLRMAPRESPGYTLEDYKKTIADNAATILNRTTAALGLSWRERYDAGHAIDVPALDFGRAQIVLMPAESFVQYQLWAQELRPDSFVMVMGYGESAPGYIPTAQDAAEGYNDHYSWVAFPECEEAMRSALRAALLG